MLLAIGLMMVLSASSVYCFRIHDGNSYYIFLKQLIWVAIGLPCAWVASRMNRRVPAPDGLARGRSSRSCCSR